jgi:hypothetical protein
MARSGPPGPRNRPQSSKGAMCVPGRPIRQPTVSHAPALHRPTTEVLCRTGATTSPEHSHVPPTGRSPRPAEAVRPTAVPAPAAAAAPFRARAVRAVALTAVRAVAPAADRTAARAVPVDR